MGENIILVKSKKFAVRIVKLRKYLFEDNNERLTLYRCRLNKR